VFSRSTPDGGRQSSDRRLMISDYLLLGLALIALCLPTAVVLPGSTRERIRRAVRRQDDGLLSLLRSPFNWIDLLRGAGGAWLAKSTVFHFSSGQDEMAMVFLAAQSLIYLVAVLAQTLWLGSPLRFIGPLFFLIGLTLVIAGVQVGGFAVALGLTCALMMRRLSLVFLFVPVFLAVFGKLFGQLGLSLIVNAAIFVLPLALAFSFGVRLSYIRRPRLPSPA